HLGQTAGGQPGAGAGVLQFDADAGNTLEERGIVAIGTAGEAQADPRYQRIALTDHNVDCLERRIERTGELGGLIGSKVDISHGNAAHAGQDGAGNVEVGGGRGLRGHTAGEREQTSNAHVLNRSAHE
ncbi:hypothetical protein GP945_32675, partial [Escherichia coli]|nr:hypothetical protein [Escherichia coli]